MRGSISKKGDIYYFILDVGYDANGKRKQKWFKGTANKKATERLMTEKISEINKGEFIEPSEEKLGDFLDTWLKTKKAKLKDSTYITYKIYIESYLKPYMAEININKLNSLHIESCLAELKNKGYENATISKVHVLLTQALDQAVKHGLMYKNPAKNVERYKIKQKQMKFWNESDIQKFLKASKDDRLYILFYLAIHTGARLGELLSLKWSDIEEGNIYIKDSKTTAGNRSVAITANNYEDIKKHRKSILEDKIKAGPVYSDNNLVIATSRGKPVSQSNCRRTFKRLVDDAGISLIRIHDLRHTHATLLLKSGVNIKVISERLGHSRTSITLDIYSHVMPNQQSEAAMKFENMLEKC